MRTAIGTRWAVPVRVEVLSGLFEGAVYDRVLVFTPSLKDQLLAAGTALEGVLRKGSHRESGGVRWVLKDVSAGH